MTTGSTLSPLLCAQCRQDCRPADGAYAAPDAQGFTRVLCGPCYRATYGPESPHGHVRFAHPRDCPVCDEPIPPFP